MRHSQLLVPALFLGALLLTFCLQVLLKRRQSEVPLEFGPTKPPVLQREPTRPPPRIAVPRGTPLPALAPRRATHQRAVSRLGNLRGVRRGMVLMTILGPCRTLEQLDPPR